MAVATCAQRVKGQGRDALPPAAVLALTLTPGARPPAGTGAALQRATFPGASAGAASVPAISLARACAFDTARRQPDFAGLTVPAPTVTHSRSTITRPSTLLKLREQ